jgi:hypothetical protein
MPMRRRVDMNIGYEAYAIYGTKELVIVVIEACAILTVYIECSI